MIFNNSINVSNWQGSLPSSHPNSPHIWHDFFVFLYLNFCVCMNLTVVYNNHLESSLQSFGSFFVKFLGISDSQNKFIEQSFDILVQVS